MQVTELFDDFYSMQLLHGDKDLDPVFGCGQIKKPKLCLVFMNPTAKNVSADKSWKGIKAPWLGTKNVWRILYQLGLLDAKLSDIIRQKRAEEWDESFAQKVYDDVKQRGLYITNLSKATQKDARALPDKVFREYLDLFKKEISIIQPKAIVTFGNQVSSVLLEKNIKVSEWRERHEDIIIDGKSYKTFPVYYPVGQGMRNMSKAKEDIKKILRKI